MRCWPALIVAIALALPAPAPAASYPSPADVRAVCRHVAARGPAIASELIKTGVLDANNDGKTDDVTVGTGQGTMGGDILEFRPRGAPAGSPAIEYGRLGFEWKDYWSLGERWLKFGGRVYTVNFESEDFRHPTYIGFIDAANTEHMACEFAAREHETLKPAARKHAALCARAARGAGAFVATTSRNDDESFATGRRNTTLKARVTADVSNAGQPQTLALLGFGFSGGRGCDFDYFDVLADGRLATSGEAHDVLARLQQLDFSDRSPYVGPTCGGNNPRWFVDGGVTYFDNASREGESRAGAFHEVRLVRGAHIETICTGAYAVTWRIKTIGPKFR